eukprot:TRINITY_DN16031_c0_g1_i1.p1 TRINITY_DN16031_c0_g1~~TRINITY_DN16031_c0_g1_i1.p1  ORF type:complete len:549 (+),score=229.66 TRINITY_DN16031_c0_g1_i1:111-1649(+)
MAGAKELGVLAVCLSCFKLLLAPAYRSTDFEVHRNWLAITHSLPWQEWYVDNTSHWTLDYPPFFAAFEWALSFPAAAVDPEMVRLDNLEYASHATVLFQRVTVIISDCLLLAAVAAYLRETARPGREFWVRLLSVVCHPGLIMVDNIHFQYNGFLYGLWALSLLAAARGRMVLCGVLFAAVLNFKHIFMYYAPAYFVFLLRRHCIGGGGGGGFLGRIAVLGAAVLCVFAASLLPFALAGLLPRLLARLFPWGRGLCHAYWAPNFYAAYNAVDLALARALGRPPAASVNTKGLVDRYEPGAPTHAVLPSLTPLRTTALTVAAFAAVSLRPLLQGRALGLLRRKLRRDGGGSDPAAELAWLCALSAAAFYLFSWHVHEKAVLMVLLPLSMLSPDQLGAEGGAACWLLHSVGCLSLWPLLFRLEEFPIKAGLTAAYVVATRRIHAGVMSRRCRALDLLLVGAVAAAAVYQSAHAALPWGDRFPFLPLLALSVAGSMAMLWGLARAALVFNALLAG